MIINLNPFCRPLLLFNFSQYKLDSLLENISKQNRMIQNHKANFV